MVPDASIAFAAVTLMASNAGGRPPIRPRARLAARAVRVRSRRSSTSNCPRAAKMWRISRPVAVGAGWRHLRRRTAAAARPSVVVVRCSRLDARTAARITRSAGRARDGPAGLADGVTLQLGRATLWAPCTRGAEGRNSR